MLSWCKWQSQFLSPDFFSFQYVCPRVHVIVTGVSLEAFYTVSNFKYQALISLVFNVHLGHRNSVFGMLSLYKWQFQFLCPYFLSFECLFGSL